VAAIGDELLCAVHPIVRPVEHQLRGGQIQVDAGAGFRKRQARDVPPVGDRSQVALLLVYRGLRRDDRGADAVHPEAQRGRRARSADDLGRDAEREQPLPVPAHGARRLQPAEPGLEERAHRVLRPCGLPVDRLGVRSYLTCHDVFDALAERAQLRREKIFHSMRGTAGRHSAAALELEAE